MDAYVIDAVAFLSYLANNLPPKADEIFKLAEKKEVQLLFPSIALGETIYIIYKGKKIFGKVIPVEKIDFIFQILQNSDNINLVDMNLTSWRIFTTLNIPELHDRMITATYIEQGANALITSDKVISAEVNVIW